MDQKYFIDKLRRALEMEEDMNVLLIGLLSEDVMPEGLTAEDARQIREILAGIRADSNRHGRFDEELLERLTKGGLS